MPWFQVQLDLPSLLREPVINRLFELGAQGVDESSTATPNVVKAFFESSARASVEKDLPTYLDSLTLLHPSVPRVTFKLEIVAEANWAESYKEFYKPQRLSAEFFLLPAWESPDLVPAGCQPIILEPGQAFGTGLHPSTQMCIRMLERAMPLYHPLSKKSLLDVGTGTGILAIVAEKLGVGKIDAIDIDPIAVTTAEENLKRNLCKRTKVSGQPVSVLKGTYDIVVSNILLEAHRELAMEYLRLLPEAGQLILSGLLSHQASEILRVFGNLGFVFESQVTLQEWTALGFTRGAEERL